MIAALLSIVLAFSLPGPNTDFDHDGDTDQSDFGRLQVELGTQAEPVCVFDLDGDGWVDGDDVDIFLKTERKPG